MRVYVVTYESCAGTLVEAVCITKIKARKRIESMMVEFGDENDELYNISEHDLEE